MNINTEEIIKIPEFGKIKNFEEIVNFLNIKFDYDRELFEKDNSYRTKIMRNFINQVIDLGNDKNKLALLYSLKKFLEFKDRSIINLVFSFSDRTLISQIAEYLDDEIQIENLSETLERVVSSKHNDMTAEEIDEIQKNIIPEIQKKKQLFLSKKKKQDIDIKDNELILKLEDLRKREYEEKNSLEVACEIKELSNDAFKISAMETYFNEICTKLRDNNRYIPSFKLLWMSECAGITEVVLSMDSDENKKLIMEEYLDKSFSYYKELYDSLGEEIGETSISEYEKYKYRCILSLDNKEAELAKLQTNGKYEDYLVYERECYRNTLHEGTLLEELNLTVLAQEVVALNSDNEKFNELKKGDIRKLIILKAGDDVINVQNGLYALGEVIRSMNSDEIKLKAYIEIFSSIYEYYDMQCNEENANVKSEIKQQNNNWSTRIIGSLEDKNLMIEKLIEFGKLENFLKYGYNVENKGDIIQNNIEKILEYYGLDDVTSKKEMLLRMKESNAKVFEQIDYRLLTDKFLSTFSEDEINLIINLDRVTIEKICNYNENEIKFSRYIIRNLEVKDDFNEYFNKIIYNIDSYKDLIESFDENSLDKEQIQKLKIIFQYDNSFDIKSMDDVNNFTIIKNKKLTEKMQEEVKEPKGTYVSNYTELDLIKEKKNAVLIKLFGIDYDTAKQLVIEFGEQTVDDKKLQMMKNIIALDNTYPNCYETDNILREIFTNERIQEKEAPLLDKIQIRKEYIKKYEKMYDEVLFKPEDGEFIKEIDGIKFYDAGTDFSILSTSIAAYSGTSDRDEMQVDEKELWNRKDLSSNHFCASFSRDDMIGMIQTDLGVYYGFDKVVPGSLLYMAAEDNQSKSSALTSHINGTRPFRSPDNMIEHTGSNENWRKDLYNEVDIKREIEGVRQAPDYIIAIKVDGIVVNEKQALNAAKQWGGDKPIVTIDVDRCLEKSMETLNIEIEEYEKNPIDENLKKVWNTFHKTSITYGAFYKLGRNNKEHKDFIEMVNLPKVLKDKIEHDSIKTYYYILKDTDIFGKDNPITQEENVAQIKKLMNEINENDLEENIEKGTQQEQLKQNYDEVTAEERKEALTQIKIIADKIKEQDKGKESKEESGEQK